MPKFKISIAKYYAMAAPKEWPTKANLEGNSFLKLISQSVTLVYIDLY